MAQLIRLIFDGEYSERDEFDTPRRGYRSGVLVALDDGLKYSVTFYDVGRLAQTVEDEARSGTPYFTEPGLIVLSRVDREHMERAVRDLAATGFFESLRPVAEPGQ